MAGYIALHGKDHDSCVFQFLMLLQEIVFGNFVSFFNVVIS